MKKSKILRTFLIGISAISLCSCNGDKNPKKITFGSYVDTTVRTIDYSGLEKKMEGNYLNETFLLFIKPTESSCRCVMNFTRIIEKYITEENSLVYAIERPEFAGKENTWNLPLQSLLKTGRYEDSPRFAIISKGKIVSKYVNPESKFFTDYDTFKAEIETKAAKPSLYYVDHDYLDAKTKSEDTLVTIIRESCGDCSYLLPNFLFNYYEKNLEAKNMLIYDLDYLYNESDVLYQAEKDYFHLSYDSDNTFGYLNGKVPTSQYWSNGSLTDACVYFNDELSLVDDNWTVTTTYYTTTRNNPFIENMDASENHIEGVIVDPQYVFEYRGVGYWDKENAATYHNKFIQAFMDMYAK